MDVAGPLTYVFLENYWVLSIPGDIYTVLIPAEPEYEVKKAKKWPDRVAHLAQRGSPESPAGGLQNSPFLLVFSMSFQNSLHFVVKK